MDEQMKINDIEETIARVKELNKRFEAISYAERNRQCKRVAELAIGFLDDRHALSHLNDTVAHLREYAKLLQRDHPTSKSIVDTNLSMGAVIELSFRFRNLSVAQRNRQYDVAALLAAGFAGEKQAWSDLDDAVALMEEYAGVLKVQAEIMAREMEECTA